jgi:hypothetical protein
VTILSFEAWPGTIGTLGRTPDRPPNSVRRATSIQSIWPDGSEIDRVTAVARGHDVLTDGDGAGTVLDAVAIDVDADGPARTVRAITADPPVAGIDDVVGAQLMGGFRRAAATAVPSATGSLLGLLLDDLPAAVLVSGQVPIRVGIEVTGALPEWVGADGAPLPMVCIGRRADGVMEQRRHAGTPLLGQGPPAGDLRRPDDPLAWPDAPPMPIRSMRRLRRTDVRVDDDTITVDSHFRDSYMEQTGVETAVHEYDVTLTAAVDDGVIRDLDVRARVLPGPDCPGAVASAQRVVAQPLETLREFVRGELRGDTICTHLNDQLRSLADVPALVNVLRRPRSTR